MTTDLKTLKKIYLETVQKEVKNQTDRLLKTIAEKYQIPLDDLLDLLTPNNDLETAAVVSSDNDEIPDKTTDKCLGKTKYHVQCTRTRQGDGLFCGSHNNKLTYGRIDINDDTEEKAAKKRGRPRKD